MSGTVYLDDIRFTLPLSPTITGLSPAEATNDVSTPLALTGTHFKMDPTVALGYNILHNVTRPSTTRLTATIPPGIAAGNHDVWLIQPNMQRGVLRDAFTVHGAYGVEVTPAAEIKCGAPGTTVTYTLWVTNTGTALDRYTVAVGGHAWSTTAPDALGPLAAGEGAQLAVEVAIPEDAVADDRDTATVTLTCSGDRTRQATATLTTVSTPGMELFLPLVLRKP
jgi:hypothetical protein